jgi:hypothetical protein
VRPEWLWRQEQETVSHWGQAVLKRQIMAREVVVAVTNGRLHDLKRQQQGDWKELVHRARAQIQAELVTSQWYASI